MLRKLWFRLLVFLLVSALFIFLRVYKIQQSFYLFGDVGRDLFVLQDWANNLFKLPLLGPQTSAISFNQSAVYFYYLFPFFLLMKYSVYSTLVASIFLYLVVFSFLFFWYRHKTKEQWQLIALYFLVSIHPQFVLQQRLVWNPSLIAPFLILSFWAWREYSAQQKNWWLIIMMAALAMAASLNYSILPTILAFILVFAWQQRKNLKAVLLSLSYGISSAIVLNLPTLVFELRHNFLLTRSLGGQEVLQQDHSWLRKITMLTTNVVRPTVFSSSSIWLFIGLILALLFIWLNNLKRQTAEVKSFVFSLLVALGSAMLLLITPLTMHEHYMFGVLTFLLISLVFLPKKPLWLVLLGASWLYLQPFYFLQYQSSAPHLAAEKISCLQFFCQDRQTQGLANQPIFVNTQSSSHNHQALEYVFLLKEFGCQAIDTQQFNATPVEEMLVVADRATFENGKTGYYELSQFGPATEISNFACKPDLKLHLLEKK